MTYKSAYGRWAGNERGTSPNFERCCEEVYSPESWQSHQCRRPRGHGPDGEYCKQHDPAAIKAKDDARRAKYDAEFARKRAMWKLHDAAPKFLETLRLIAAGHNDARSIASEAIKDFSDDHNNR